MIVYLIESKSCFTANEIAARIGVSKRTILRMIERLREMDKNVRFCKRENKYFIEK